MESENQKTIELETPSSPIDYFSNTYCNCFHLISEHINGRCYGLDNRGNLWVACYCNSINSIIYTIKGNENENNGNKGI
jgi:hypothetical protein